MKTRTWLATIFLMIAGITVTLVTLLGDRDTYETSTFHATPTSLVSSETDGLDWCADHRVPESECTKCNPSLIDKFRESGDWCAGHGVPESHCRLCNPDIQFPQELALPIANVNLNTGLSEPGPLENADSATELDWCAEHSVPESECTQCNPALVDEFRESGDWCIEHAMPESHCRLCNPDIVFPQEEMIKRQSLKLVRNEIEVSLFFRPNAAVCATDGALIQFASTETADKSGISVRQVIAAPFESVLEAPAEVVFDESNTTVVTSTVAALVDRWIISPGDVVKKGDVLAILQSAEMTELQAGLLSINAEYQVQLKELNRHEELKSRNLISESDFERQVALTEQARAKFTSAYGLLLSTGITGLDIDELMAVGTVSNKFALRAPNNGLVVERIAQLGDLLEGGRAFAVIADPSSMWVEAQLTEEQMKNVSVGQHLYFASDGRGLDRVGGEVIWVSRFLDPHTRTGTVRASVSDPTHNLQAGEFGRVTITMSKNAQVTLVPKDAVQWEGCCNVVFVRESVDRYRPRKIQLADGHGPYYQVTDGLLPGEEVVVDGSFLLKTELKKTSIGAGCCGIEPTS